MTALEVATLFIGVLEGILGVVYLIFRWEPRWIGRGRPWAFTQGLTEIFASMFIISFLLPKVADWRGAVASALALTAAVSFVLFLGIIFVPLATKRRRERSILPRPPWDPAEPARD